MSQINSNTKDDFQVVLLLSCFVGHPVYKYIYILFIKIVYFFMYLCTVNYVYVRKNVVY